MTDAQYVSLKEYIDTLIDAQCKKLDLYFKAMDDRFQYLNLRLDNAVIERDKALETAKGELDRRLEGMNHLKAEMDKQVATFLPRPEYMARVEKYDKDVEFLRSFVSKAEGAATQKSVYVAWAFSFIGIVVAIVLPIVIAALKH